MNISKSLYLDYLDCPKNAWLKLHKKNELKDYFEESDYDKHLANQGMKVEKITQKLFPEGVLLNSSFDKNSLQETLGHIQIQTSVIFQPTFQYDCFLARSDVLEYDEKTKKWNLYEIKSVSNFNKKSNDKKNKKIKDDISFQSIVLEESGVSLNKVFVVHLNNKYSLNDKLDIRQLFSIIDITDEVKERKQGILQSMQAAKRDLINNKEEDITCICIKKGRSSHCLTFKYSNKYCPGYSIHDIRRIGSSKKKLAWLVDKGYLRIDAVPKNFELKNYQKKQIETYIKGPHIDISGIMSEFSRLKYPLYFLDYETYDAAIPLFKGFKPYEQVTFQFSIHKLNCPEDELQHFEYLHVNNSDPSLIIIKELKRVIGERGSIIVWNKAFEEGRNKELAKRYLEHEYFLNDINNRIYDLEDIFKLENCIYIHPSFKGSSSIKNVLPVICPELTYKKLGIQEGQTASIRWYEMIYGKRSNIEKQKIVNDLKKYCELDTFAMYAIWRHLNTLCDSYNQKISRQKNRNDFL